MKYNVYFPYEFKPSFPYLARCSTAYVGGEHIATETNNRGAVAAMISKGAARGILATTLTMLCIAMITACGTQSRKMAGEGAASGAVVGAVGGMVSALVFGGDVGDRAARGAVWGRAPGRRLAP